MAVGGPRARAVAAAKADIVALAVGPLASREEVARLTAGIARESLMILRGSPREMADELQRRRDSLGISYVSVNAAFMEAFAPVVELLAGR